MWINPETEEIKQVYLGISGTSLKPKGKDFTGDITPYIQSQPF